MRCPKCGFISFDNLENCLKCNKDISVATKAFQGSIQNVATPSFLKFSVPDDDIRIEGAAEVGGEIEFADPDLEILVDDGEASDQIDFNLDGGDDSDDNLPLAADFDEGATFGADEEDDIDLSADLGQFEDVPEDDTFSFDDFDDEPETTEGADLPEMDLPDELNDISDLLPPDSIPKEEPSAEQFEEPIKAEPEDDLDFSNLDFDLSGAEEVAAGESVAEKTAQDGEYEGVSPSAVADMDDDLDFQLDLGGLTIKDAKN